MTKKPNWAHNKSDDSLTIHRPGRARLDVKAQTTLQGQLHLTRLAHAIRQDIWRKLQTTRGFTPIVIVKTDTTGTYVTAGGQIDGAVPPALSQIIEDVLNNPQNRRRWQQWARKR